MSLFVVSGFCGVWVDMGRNLGEIASLGIFLVRLNLAVLVSLVPCACFLFD